MSLVSSPLAQKSWVMSPGESKMRASSSSKEVLSGSDSDSDLGSLSTLSSALEESSEEESSDEDEKRAQLRNAYKADITPHHRIEKRPQRRTAAKASDAWSDLSPRIHRKKDLEVVIEVPSRGRGRPKKETPKKNREASVEREVQTPTKRAHKETPIQTPKGKEKARESEALDEQLARTPTKRQRVDSPRTDRQQKGPVTPTSTSKRKNAVPAKETRGIKRRIDLEDNNNLIRPTSSDAYFANHAPRSKRRSSKHQTSDNILSGTLPIISSKVVARLSSNIAQQLQMEGESSKLLPALSFEQHYDYWWSLLVCTNRPLLMYGVGSKRAHMQGFARYLAKEGRSASVVVRGESGGRIEDVIREMERYIQITNTSLEQRRVVSTPLEARAHSLVEAMQGKGVGEYNLPPSFLILIHNFDTTLLLQEKSLNMLRILSASKRIHLCVETSHVNSGLISQLHSESEQGSLAWLWINMTTYVPMLEEIVNERGPGIVKTIGLPRILDIRAAGGGGSDMVFYNEANDEEGNGLVQSTRNGTGQAAAATKTLSNSTPLLSERAAIHILRSVTVKAKKLFYHLGLALLERGEKRKEEEKKMTYKDLSDLARTSFLAFTPDSLRSLLVEFTSHGLIRVEGQAQQHNHNQNGDLHDQSQGMIPVSGDANVTIALGKVDLTRVLDEFKEQV